MIRDVLALAAAVLLTMGAFRFRGASVLPTLAFFAWAWVFARMLVLHGHVLRFDAEEEPAEGELPEAMDDGGESKLNGRAGRSGRQRAEGRSDEDGGNGNAEGCR
jgi:hypothetical protein